ncbi:Asp23/Gls24 family envelope stress response protein [Brevibacterium oceani]|uniref:Asp23/Gls24 family envelope stress response protein n=1 Tax=Brevibacterium oceani TaxID=358099 RepID=UPI0015E68EFF|nr:Asp23/Gls24 family envelope stress response protein [Brevibacterium oceani]
MPEAKQSDSNQTTQNNAADVRSPLVTDMGTTTIAENVVAKLTGIAAREVPGVFGMGNAARRAFDTLTDRIPGSQTNVSGGVSVEKGEKQTAIDLTIVVEYGTSIVDVAEAIRRNVVRAVEQGTGLQVVEVNIDVTDVHLPEEDDTEDKPAKDSPELN